MQLDFSPITIEQFLAEYWQKKPLLLKGGIKNFENPVEPDELAGLASESNIESRVIFQQSDTWQAQSGPFEDYETYGDSHWSLVVQSVNHWMPNAQEFARLFDFIPQWRFDDVMVSFATPHGGVGPHVDNYDVFICQGSGQRRWKVGDLGSAEEYVAHEKLRHVQPFEAIIDDVVEAGDVLYIPPGFPHEGISLDNSMSFSVGYKSVNSTELLSGFADYLIDFEATPKLLSDSDRIMGQYGQVGATDIALLRNLLNETIEDEERLNDFIGVYYSQSRSELDLVEDEYDYEEWLSEFTKQPLIKLQAVKMLYTPDLIEQGIFYVDGEKHCVKAPMELLKNVCDCSEIDCDSVSVDAVLEWLWQSTNKGYWYFAT